MYPNWNFMLDKGFPFLNIWTFLHFYLVMYVVKRCPWNSTFVDAQNSHQSICVCLGTWTMHYNNGSARCSIYYYLKDLDRVHLACKGLPYGDRDQTLFIDDEPNKAFQNPKWNGLFLEPFKGRELSKNKVQWLNLASRLWPTLKGFPFTKMIYAHFVIIM